MIGNAAAWGAVALTKKAFERDHPETVNTAAAFAGIAAFWLAGGLGWVLLTRSRVA